MQPTLLAKIYSRPPLAGYDQKLGWMAANPPDDPTHAQGHASIAWPRDLIYDEQRRLVGYVMAYVQNAAPILTVFNPRLRTRTLPNFDHRYLYRTARNLAAALGALHASNYVVGDLNESNVMVTPSALVTLIDTDSFQVQRRAGAKPVLHPCPVGKPEYTPPELQGKSFQHTARLPEHDRFGLAVLIFQLLMEGNHPFRAQWLGAGDPPPIEARIRDGGWPYAPTAYLLAPPRYTPGLNTLPPPVVDLVRHCFVEGHRDPRQRPAPHEWERALAEAEKALMPCGRGHYYPNHLRECLQCQAQQAQQARRPTNESAQSGLLHEHAQPASPFSSARPWPYRRLFSIGFSLLRSVL
ncbi:MAG: helix-hairpin-helix domain-containing protein, partial [Anaerolineales bacterium]